MFNERACEGAAEKGQLETLKWLKREGCPWADVAVTVAAEFGRIEILEWLRSEGEVFDEEACAWAAASGQLETLEWLRNLDPPCPWNKSHCRRIAEGNGYDDVLNGSDVVSWIDQQPDRSDDEGDAERTR